MNKREPRALLSQAATNPTMSNFPALPGFYNVLFLYLEPLSALGGAISCLLYPGVEWFYHGLVPSALSSSDALDARSVMAVSQLANCYFLLALISTFVFRAIRDTLPNNPIVQERILGAAFLALGLADLTHILATLLVLPADVKFDFANWNSLTHGNVTVVIVLCAFRISWYLGFGRTRYWFGQSDVQLKKAT